MLKKRTKSKSQYQLQTKLIIHLPWTRSYNFWLCRLAVRARWWRWQYQKANVMLRGSLFYVFNESLLARSHNHCFHHEPLRGPPCVLTFWSWTNSRPSLCAPFAALVVCPLRGPPYVPTSYLQKPAILVSRIPVKWKF